MVAFATQVKRRRGTAEQNNEFTGAEGEIVVNLTDKSLRVHDGQTKGGFETLRQNMQNSVNITNCITEIPQDIKLEIIDGAVVLKAGSKGYRPNGAGVFNQITASTDISKTTSTDGVYMVVSWGLSSLELVNINSFFSGATQPVNPPRISVWYDTTNNVIKQTYDSGATWGGTLLFPLGIVTVSNGSVSSIDQVFNGFGYIGSCVFTLPGVKGLYPNGRNKDGTLKNGLINCTDVQVSSNFNDTIEHTLMINPNGRCAWYSTTGWYYNDIANVMVASTGTVLFSATLGTFKTTNGVVSNLNPYEAFHAVDYSEYKNTIDWVRTQTSNVVRLVEEQKPTSENNYTWYRKYDNGLVEQGGIHHRGSAGDTVNLPIAMSNEYYELQLTAVNPTNINRYAYANTYTSTYFKCGTADDQSPNNDGDIRWYVCGYAAN